MDWRHTTSEFCLGLPHRISAAEKDNLFSGLGPVIN